MNRKLYIFYKIVMDHLTQKVVKTVVTTTYLGGKNVDITKETFISHPEYAKLPESVLVQVNDIIPDLVYWVNYGYIFGDDMYGCEPRRSDWDCDENSGSWEDARESMGTTSERFCVPNRRVAHFFRNFGFRTLICRFSPWRKGYDYDIYDMNDECEPIVESFHRNYDYAIGEDDYEYICLAFWPA